MAQGLPISLVELNTFAYTVCTLLIYYFWWDKPLDIEEPTKISGKSVQGACAWLCYFTEFDGQRDSDYLEFINSGIEPSPVLCLRHASSGSESSAAILTTSLPIRQTKLAAERQKLYMGQSIAGLYYQCYQRHRHYAESRCSGERGILSLY